MKDCLKQRLGVSILAQLSAAEQSTGLMSLGGLMITFSARQRFVAAGLQATYSRNNLANQSERHPPP